jgi:hypothetical protein
MRGSWVVADEAERFRNELSDEHPFVEAEPPLEHV